MTDAAYERQRRAFAKQFVAYYAPMLDGVKGPARERLLRRMSAYARRVYDYIGPRRPSQLLAMRDSLERRFRELVVIHDDATMARRAAAAKLKRRKSNGSARRKRLRL